MLLSIPPHGSQNLAGFDRGLPTLVWLRRWKECSETQHPGSQVPGSGCPLHPEHTQHCGQAAEVVALADHGKMRLRDQESISHRNMIPSYFAPEAVCHCAGLELRYGLM